MSERASVRSWTIRKAEAARLGSTRAGLLQKKNIINKKAFSFYGNFRKKRKLFYGKQKHENHGAFGLGFYKCRISLKLRFAKCPSSLLSATFSVLFFNVSFNIGLNTTKKCHTLFNFTILFY
ncbi:hypothetical protein D8M03_14150 [Lysinibacillus endophyticus]|uniref:Uncharacterized protein n=1 Tax=Ureibacillus endophyticus TaxID=1978490 RepID=A0A494YW45_9BACL|nr:hypothetical protein D8M03_14150 [Lysinibacillus endophyticus]